MHILRVNLDVSPQGVLAIKEDNVILILFKLVLLAASRILNVVKAGTMIVEIVAINHSQLVEQL